MEFQGYFPLYSLFFPSVWQISKMLFVSCGLGRQRRAKEWKERWFCYL